MTVTATTHDGRPDERDPLALDPYSPSFPSCAPDPTDPEPLALDPYGPILPRRAPEAEDPAS